jgi:hypothetical protein
MSETPEHLRPTELGNRGFVRFPTIPSEYGGAADVGESSAAMEPSIWLIATAPADLNRPDGEQVEAPLHFTAENAWKLAEQLMTLVANHYQGDARPPERRADLRSELRAEEAEYDSETDTWYLRILDEPVHHTIEGIPVTIDWTRDGTMVGLYLLPQPQATKEKG